MTRTNRFIVPTFIVALLAAPTLGAATALPSEDARLTTRIESRFQSNRVLFPHALDARVESGVVHLSGTVNSESERELALELASGVEGVHSVSNDIVVAEGPSTAVTDTLDDSAITARVKARLMWNSGTDGLDLEVSTHDGEVTLAGTVDDQAEADLARTIALDTEGVRAVKTNFTFGTSGVDQAEAKVKEAARELKRDVDDAWISGKVTKAIALDKRFFDTQVDVHTEDGIVTLTGEVGEPRQRDEMIAAVRSVVGVRDVRADIVIR